MILPHSKKLQKASNKGQDSPRRTPCSCRSWSPPRRCGPCSRSIRHRPCPWVSTDSPWRLLSDCTRGRPRASACSDSCSRRSGRGSRKSCRIWSGAGCSRSSWTCNLHRKTCQTHSRGELKSKTHVRKETLLVEFLVCCILWQCCIQDTGHLSGKVWQMRDIFCLAGPHPPADHLIESRLIGADQGWPRVGGWWSLVSAWYSPWCFTARLGWSLRMGGAFLFQLRIGWVVLIQWYILWGKLLSCSPNFWQNKKNLRQNKADCVWRDICGFGTVFLSREKRKWNHIRVDQLQPRDWQKIKIGSGHKSLLSRGEIRIEFWIFFWLVRVIMMSLLKISGSYPHPENHLGRETRWSETEIGDSRRDLHMNSVPF